MGFEVMPPPRVMLHDMVSMAISLGGLVLVVFTGTSAAGAPDDYDLQSSLDSTKFGEAFTLRRLMMAAQWFMVAVVYVFFSPTCMCTGTCLTNVLMQNLAIDIRDLGLL